MRKLLRVAVFVLVLLPFFGCSSFLEDLCDKVGPAYKFDADNHAITPRNDPEYWNGWAMDARTTAPATAAGKRSP